MGRQALWNLSGRNTFTSTVYSSFRTFGGSIMTPRRASFFAVLPANSPLARSSKPHSYYPRWFVAGGNHGTDSQPALQILTQVGLRYDFSCVYERLELLSRRSKLVPLTETKYLPDR